MCTATSALPWSVGHTLKPTKRTRSTKKANSSSRSIIWAKSEMGPHSRDRQLPQRTRNPLLREGNGWSIQSLKELVIPIQSALQISCQHYEARFSDRHLVWTGSSLRLKERAAKMTYSEPEISSVRLICKTGNFLTHKISFLTSFVPIITIFTTIPTTDNNLKSY